MLGQLPMFDCQMKKSFEYEHCIKLVLVKEQMLTESLNTPTNEKNLNQHSAFGHINFKFIMN